MIELSAAPLLAATISAAALAGCETFQPEPYQPERTIVAAIPREAALKAVRELLAIAHPYKPAWKDARNRLSGIEVTERAFKATFYVNFSTETREYVYAQLDPKAFRDPEEGGGYFVALRGGDGTFFTSTLADAHILWFERREDLEKLLEALASLR